MSNVMYVYRAETRMPSPAPEQRALIVAPDDAGRERLARLLIGWGVQVTACIHLLESAALLHQGWAQAQPFDLVLFSPQGHQVDPAAFAAMILSDPRAARIALVHIGEVQGSGARGRLRQAGFLDFLAEEFDTRNVFEAVQWALGRQAPLAPDQARVVSLSNRQAKGNSGDRRVDILIADPDEAHLSIARHALADTGRQLTEVTNGEAVLAAVGRHAFDIVVLALDCGDFLAHELMGIMRFTAALGTCPVFIGVGDPSGAQDGDFAVVVDTPLRANALTRAVRAVLRVDTAAPVGKGVRGPFQ